MKLTKKNYYSNKADQEYMSFSQFKQFNECQAKAMAILISLVGAVTAVKVWSLIKMLKIKVEGWEQKDFEELLQDPRFLKYMR